MRQVGTSPCYAADDPYQSERSHGGYFHQIYDLYQIIPKGHNTTHQAIIKSPRAYIQALASTASNPIELAESKAQGRAAAPFESSRRAEASRLFQRQTPPILSRWLSQPRTRLLASPSPKTAHYEIFQVPQARTRAASQNMELDSGAPSYTHLTLYANLGVATLCRPQTAKILLLPTYNPTTTVVVGSHTIPHHTLPHYPSRFQVSG